MLEPCGGDSFQSTSSAMWLAVMLNKRQDPTVKSIINKTPNQMVLRRIRG